MTMGHVVRHLFLVIFLFAAPFSGLKAQDAVTPGAATALYQEQIARLTKRVEELEQRLADLQIVHGTLESLSRDRQVGVPATILPGGAPNAPGALSVDAANRLSVLETQIRALSGQMEQLSQKVGGINGAPLQTPQAPVQTVPRPLTNTPPVDPSGFDARVTTNDGFPPEALPIQPQQDLQTPPVQTQPAVRPKNDWGQQAVKPAAPKTAKVEEPARADLDKRQPKLLYEEAFGRLVSRDYAAAEAGFSRFLKQYPNDALAGNAQYWLGESLFVRRKYREAANHFLKGYTKYSKGAKAPESLLKLALSLNQLGQKDAACTTFGELNSKFPNAPTRLRQKAKDEMQKAGC